MRKKLMIGLAVVAALLVVLVIVVSMQPSTYHVERSAVMAAEPLAVFREVNDFRRWESWSPWAKLDPNAENSFEGPAAGEGAIFRWDGNDDVGAGSMEIIASEPPTVVAIDLRFVRPFEDQADVKFAIKPEGEGSEVTWIMHGRKNFMAKFMCMFMDMDAMIGTDFEKGLASLKQVVEFTPSPPPADSTDPTTDEPAAIAPETPAEATPEKAPEPEPVAPE